MKIKIERSGGFAGINKSIVVDTNDMPENIVQVLKNHIRKSKQPCKNSSSIKNKAFDCYYYKLSPQVVDEKTDIRISEFELNKDIRKLLNKLFETH